MGQHLVRPVRILSQYRCWFSRVQQCTRAPTMTQGGHAYAKRRHRGIRWQRRLRAMLTKLPWIVTFQGRTNFTETLSNSTRHLVPKVSHLLPTRHVTRPNSSLLPLFSRLRIAWAAPRNPPANQKRPRFQIAPPQPPLPPPNSTKGLVRIPQKCKNAAITLMPSTGTISSNALSYEIFHLPNIRK